MHVSKVALSLVIALSTLGNAAPACADSNPSLTRGLARQDRLFLDQAASDLAASPLNATAEGDHRYDSQVDHFSIAAARAQNEADRKYLKQALAIDPTGFPEEDRISHDLFVRMLRQRITDFELREFEMPLTQISGVHLTLADIPKSVPLTTAGEYRAYVQRLAQIPRALAETEEVLRRGRKDQLMPYKGLLEKVPSEIAGIVQENAFLDPIRRFPPTIDADAQEKLAREITALDKDQVLPAFQRFSEFIIHDYAPYGRISIAESSLPEGLRHYQNAIREQSTTSLTPDEIHRLGLSEVARLTGLLENLAHAQGFASLSAYRSALKADPRYKPSSPDQIVDDFRRYISGMKPHLAEVLNHVPDAPLSIEQVPPSQPANATHYLPGAPDGSRPGRIVIATSDYARRSLLSDETIAYHEGIPGHHIQVSIQQRLTALPAFRRNALTAAYAEGWAVYSEGLAKEMGFFKDPASDYGRLTTELLRAARLVVDTGIHAQGWTRAQAVSYMQNLAVADEPTIQVEVDRYIAWPAQGLSYKLGQLKILELRERARARLREHFDIRAFHDQVLQGGNLPLDILEARIDRWLDKQKRPQAEIAPA